MVVLPKPENGLGANEDMGGNAAADFASGFSVIVVEKGFVGADADIGGNELDDWDNFSSFFGETVKDVVLTAAYAILGRWNEAYDLWDESRAMALLTNFGVRELGDRLYGTLSEGEKKRVQISRALMTDPELLLLDEPAAGVNPALLDLIIDRIMAINAQGVAVLLISAELAEVMALSDRAAVMRDGKLVAVRTTAQTKARQKTTCDRMMEWRPKVTCRKL